MIANGVAILVAAAVGAVLGGRRGVSDVQRKTQHNLEALVAAQELRIAHLERDNAQMEKRIEELEAELGRMREELKAERRISARIGKP